MNVFLRGASGSWGRGRFKGSLFGKSYETKYCVCRLVIWHDVWRHVGLSDAKNSNEKGTECKSYSSFTVFLLCFGTFIFVLCVPGFSKITVVTLHEFWFCFLHFVQFTNLNHRAK